MVSSSFASIARRILVALLVTGLTLVAPGGGRDHGSLAVSVTHAHGEVADVPSDRASAMDCGSLEVGKIDVGHAVGHDVTDHAHVTALAATWPAGSVTITAPLWSRGRDAAQTQSTASGLERPPKPTIVIRAAAA